MNSARRKFVQLNVFRMTVAAFFLMVMSATSFAQKQQWIPENISARAIMKKQEGRLVSSDALVLPDGRVALITYYQTVGRTYRCIDYYKTAEFVNDGFACFRLAKPE